MTFEGYSFFVPKDSMGKPVVLEGKVIVKEPDPAEVAHLKSEGAGAAAAAGLRSKPRRRDALTRDRVRPAAGSS